VTASPATKTEWRAHLIAARREVSSPQRAIEAAAIADVVRHLVHAGQTVCSYVPVGTEPGSHKLIDDLLSLDVQVLLPVVVGAHPLDWAVYDGSLQAGPHRLLEPTSPRLGPAAIGSASLVLVPALAVDQAGTRLGRGAGHYDRSLLLAAPDAMLAGVVRDQEFLPHLPSDEHDVKMTAVLTPGRGLIQLSGS
jgi:5-formyltetrahydrofolate cyclo-ligase